MEFRHPLLYLVACQNKLTYTRFKVITSKKLGKAHDRNRIRRVFVGAFLKIMHNIRKNVDMVLLPNRACLGIKGEQATGLLMSAASDFASDNL